MDKSDAFNRFIKTLRSEFEQAAGASRDAAEYATDPESKAESQWDTQGLEASYLAAGQASHAKKMFDDIQSLEKEKAVFLLPCADVRLGAIFRAEIASELSTFLVANAGGGTEVRLADGATMTIITPKSPIFARVVGLKAGSDFVMANGSLCSIVAVY